MTDFCDDASVITERDLAQILAARKLSVEEPWEEDGVRYCLDCGTSIPVARVDAVDAVRCVDCQARREHRQHTQGTAP